MLFTRPFLAFCVRRGWPARLCNMYICTHVRWRDGLSLVHFVAFPPALSPWSAATCTTSYLSVSPSRLESHSCWPTWQPSSRWTTTQEIPWVHTHTFNVTCIAMQSCLGHATILLSQVHILYGTLILVNGQEWVVVQHGFDMAHAVCEFMLPVVGYMYVYIVHRTSCSVLPKTELRHIGREWFGRSLWSQQSFRPHPFPTSKKNRSWRNMGPICLTYAGENTVLY